MSRWKTNLILVLLSFPLTDYLLRRWFQIPLISSLWDEAVFFLLFFFVLIHMIEKDRPLPQIKVPLTAFTALGLGHIFLDLPHFAAGLDGFRAVFQYILAFFLGFYLIDDEQEAVRYLRFLSIIGVLAAVVGVAQVALGVETPSQWTDVSEQGLIRAFSFVVSPNVLGSYMALVAPITVGLFFYERKPIWRWSWLAAALLVLAAFFLSGSRGAWLALFGALGLVFMIMNRKWLFVSIAAGIGAFLFVPVVRARILNLFSPEYFEKSANDGRIARWMNAYHQMRFDPFFGKGIGHYGGAVGNRHFGTTYVDSYYFKTLAEMGLIGILLLVWLFALTLILMIRIWKTQKGERSYGLLGGVVIGCLAVILHNGVENIFEVPFMSTYYWFLTGLILAFPFLKKGEQP